MAVLIASGCGTPFLEIQPDVLCSSHCWSIKHCEQDRSPRVQVVNQPPITDCFDDCADRMDARFESKLREAHSYGGEACDYVDFYASRFGETIDCGVDSRVDGLDIFDCYVR